MSDSPLQQPQPEPWLRGAIPGVEPFVAPVFFTFTQVREDLATHTAGLTQDDVWRRVGSLPPLGFHLRHIAGSVDRLTTYLMGEALSGEQLAFLKQETSPGASLHDLLAGIDSSLHHAQERIANVDPAAIYEARYIGRQRLPSTVLGLIVHIAEHTQRHLGQAITTAKLLREG